MTCFPLSRKPMIMDACVLIDFIKADPMVLKLMVNYVGPLCANILSNFMDRVKKQEDQLKSEN